MSSSAIANRQSTIAEEQLPRALVRHVAEREAREILEALRALMALQKWPQPKHPWARRKFNWYRKLARQLEVSPHTVSCWWVGTQRPNETNLQRLRALLEAERGVAS